MATDETAGIVSHENLGSGYSELVLSCPTIAGAVQPGQFVHIRIPQLEASALRRPFSVFDAQDGRLTILYKNVGRGTSALVKAPVGSELQVLGPLGRGFPQPEEIGALPLLVAGGYGVAPLHFLAKRLAGRRGIVFAGGRKSSDLLALDRFRALGWEVRTATEDGSEGVKGYVTAPLDEAMSGLMSKGVKFEIFACGPDGLLKAASDRAVSAGVPGWISMDRHMVCGVGACFACIQKVRLPNGTVSNARCCVNGPVFKASELVWEK